MGAARAHQREARVAHGAALLKRWGRRWAEFRRKLITEDETYVLFKTPDTPDSASEWRPIGSERPKVSRLERATAKIMLVIFWDYEGPVHFEYFKPTKERPGLTGALYKEILKRLEASVAERRPGKLERGVLLLQDNAPCHRVSDKTLPELGMRALAHPPYSPDLAPSDFYLFPVLKNFLRGKNFATEEELKSAVASFLQSKPSEFYKRGVDKLREQCEAVVKSGGEYLPE